MQPKSTTVVVSYVITFLVVWHETLRITYEEHPYPNKDNLESAWNGLSPHHRILHSPASVCSDARDRDSTSMTDTSERLADDEEPEARIWWRSSLNSTVNACQNYVICRDRLLAHNSCATRAPIIESTREVLRYPRNVRSNAIHTDQYSISNIKRPRIESSRDELPHYDHNKGPDLIGSNKAKPTSSSNGMAGIPIWLWHAYAFTQWGKVTTTSMKNFRREHFSTRVIHNFRRLTYQDDLCSPDVQLPHWLGVSRIFVPHTQHAEWPC